jgi:hypothetical protein
MRLTPAALEQAATAYAASQGLTPRIGALD